MLARAHNDREARVFTDMISRSISPERFRRRMLNLLR